MDPDESTLALPVRRIRAARRSPLGRAATGVIERALPTAGRFFLVWLTVYAFAWADQSKARTVAIAAACAVVWVVLFNLARSVSERTAGTLGPLSATTLGTVAGIFAISGIDSWANFLGFGFTRMLAMSGVVFVLALAWEEFLARAAPEAKRVLIVGRTESASELVHELRRAQRRFTLIGAIDDGFADAVSLGAEIKGGTADLENVVRETRPGLVVVCAERNRPEVFQHLLEAAESGFDLLGLPEFYEYAFGKVPVRHLSAAWFMSVLHLYQRPYTRFAKRSFDIAVASAGLLLTTPLMLLVATLVKTTPGPVIYRQTRLGEGGRFFTIYKFRTMRDRAEEPGHPVWASKNDPRVTALGRVLRKTRLDELPQLWNVLKGDMAIVGPRPERPEFVRMIEASVPFWNRRHLLKPGITGWAQVCHGYAADTESTEEKLSYDLWYLRHQSLLVDLLICVKTATRLLPATSGAH